VRPLLFLIALCATVSGGSTPARAALPDQGLEYSVKAAFVFNLANFTTWPSSALPDATPLRVCVAQPDPFGGAVNQVFRNEQVAGHHVVVTSIRSPDEVHGCNLLFIGSGADSSGALLKTAAGMPILTIGETPGFEQRGGVITFVIDQGRVRFDVNREAAEHAGIQLSSKILQVARRIS
jgi:hypothetical protein